MANKVERWVLTKMLPFISGRYRKVFAGGGGGKSGGIWTIASNDEDRLAYDAVKKNVWQYAAIYAIASSAAMLTFGTFKKAVSTKGGDYELDENDKITRLFAKPNPYQTSHEFMEASFWSLELSGKLFYECVPSKQNPEQIYVLDPRRMTVLKDAKKFIVGYEYDLNGEPVPLTPDQVVFHRYHDPNDPWEGLSASTPAGDSINSDISANVYNNSFFTNSAIPALVMEFDRRIDQQEAEKIERHWAKGFRGGKKSHKLAVMWGGGKLSPIQKTPRDMEFVKQKALNREEILSSYGVPPVIVGLLEQSNYGNSKEQKKLFWQQTMMTKLASFAQRMSMEFGLDGVKRKTAFDLTVVDALQEDHEIRSRVAFNLAKASIMTPDELRRIFYKLPPLPNGTGATIWVPTNMVPANLQMNGPAASKPTGNGQSGKPGGPDAQSKPDGQKPGSNDGKPAGKSDEEVFDEAADQMIKRILRIAEEEMSQPVETLRAQILVG
jgi:HK97 family phage portal protein